jgi:HTH-type transcriptional regulator / antitoxin MqsA
MLMKTPTLCPLCGEGQVTSRCEDVAQTYGSHTCAVPMYFRSCDHCGSDFAGADESLLNRRAMMAFRKRVDSRLPGSRVLALREKYKITQAQAARLFGGGPVSFSKYENDDVEQSEAMDTLLRLVDANESVFWSLIDLRGMRAEFVRTQTQPLIRSQASYLIQPSAENGGPSPVYEPRAFRRFEQDGVENTRSEA